MFKKYWIIYVFLIYNFSHAEDVMYSVNTLKILHKVSDKYLSISIDPAVLLAGVNLSDASLILAKHLSPAYIRLAGPSTSFVKYTDIEEVQEKLDSIYITPSMWFGINEWFSLAKLTPVFGINDKNTEKGVWNPKSSMPLFEMSDKFRFTCFWQLGYDCSNKTATQYIEDLNILKQTVSGFPEHNGTWKVVASDLSTCNFHDLRNIDFQNYIRELEDTIDAIMWQSPSISKDDLGLTKSDLWAYIPKESKTVTFSSAINFAIKAGQAAVLQYDVLFREPRFLEITHDTPVYWFSFLHKKLMGSIVLKISTTNPITNLHTFAHCTRRQNYFTRSGAVTVMIINNESQPNTANVMLGSFIFGKYIEVQSYFLTASNQNISSVMINEEEITMDMLRSNYILKPKLKRAKITTYISLEIPPQTIGFFVLTDAKCDLCKNNEDVLNSILEDITGDQSESLLFDKSPYSIEGRHQTDGGLGTSNQKRTLEMIRDNILKEAEHDKSYYSKMSKNPLLDINTKVVYNQKQDDDKKKKLHTDLKDFIEKSKEKKNNQIGLKNKKEKPTNSDLPSTNLYFTIKEVEEILKRRAKVKAAAKRINLSSSELDMLIEKATLKIPKHIISQRDINRVLLEEKANYYRNNHFTQEVFEDMVKAKKVYPKFKFGRSLKRDINRSLLIMKAALEEHKKCLRTKRDINLDMLKKKTQLDSKYGRTSKVVVQPNFKNRQKLDFIESGRSYAPSHGQSNEELFDDYTILEERALEESFEDSFAEPDSVELHKLREKFLNPNSNTKPKYNFDSLFKIPKRKKLKLSSDKYLQFLKPSNADADYHNRREGCAESFEYSSYGPKYGKQKEVIRVWGSEPAEEAEKRNMKQSIFGNFEEFDYFGDYYQGYFRKKRETMLEANTGFKSLKKELKSKLKEIKKEMKQEKLRYLEQKLKSTAQSHQLKSGKRRRMNNIQVISKNKISKDNNMKPVDIMKLREKADSNENTIPPPVYHVIDSPNYGQRSRRYIAEYSENYVNNDIFDDNSQMGSKSKDYKSELFKELKNALGNKTEEDEDNNFGIEETHKEKASNVMETTEINISAAKPYTGEKVDVPVVAEKFKTHEPSAYLERVLGKKKVDSISDFFKGVKNKLHDTSIKVKGFFENIFG